MVRDVMALRRRAVSINLASGLDTKTDSKHVVPGSLTVLENGVYRKNNRLDKRSGHSEIPNVDISSNALGVGSGVESFNDELLQYNSQKVYSYSDGAEKWVDKGAAVSAIVQSKQIIKNTATQSQADSAIVNGVGVYAWEDSRGGVRASVIDETTGAALLSDVSLDASATRARCLAFNSYLYVFYYKSSGLYVRRVNPLTPSSFDSAVTVSTTVNSTTPVYDVFSYQNLRMMFAHNVQPTAEVTTITAVADVSDSLDGKTFILQDNAGSVAFWIDVDDSGTTIPAEASAADRAVEITTIVTDDDAATVGGKLRTAVGADSQFSTSGADETCIVTDASTGTRGDADASTSGFTIVQTTEGLGSSIKIGWLDDAPSVQAGVLAPTYVTEAASGCLAIVQGPNQTFYIGYHDGSDVKCTILNNGANELYAPFSLETIGSIVNITGYQVDDEDGVQFLYEVDAAQDYNQYIKECKANDDGTAGTPSVFKRSVGLYTKAFTYNDDDGNQNSFVGVVHDSTLQATYFIVRDDGLIVGKQQYSNAGGLTTRPILANVTPTLVDTVFNWAILKKNRITSENATIFTPTGVMKTSIDFSDSNIFVAKQLGNNLLIVGGVLSMYDGESIVEHGFHLYPENVTAAVAGSGGSVPLGTFQIYVIYEWTDQYGQIHRSQPSVASSVTTSANDIITVTVPTLRLTRKDGTNRTNVSIVVYMTEASGTVPYRITSVSSPTYNDVTTDTVDVVIDDITGLTSNEILYTTGGVLPNVPAPACSVIEVFQNRLWLGGLEEANSVIFSKENKAGEPVEFAEDFTKAVESSNGRVKAFGVIDDKILIMKKDRIYFTFGDGPNNTNTLGGFSEIQTTTADVGTDNAKSIANLPNGLIMKTTKGFYSVDSTLNPQYIGAPVEDYNSLMVTSGSLLADSNEVRFTTSNGDLLIYNYYFGKWSTATGLKASDSVIFGNSHVILKTDGTILKQNDSIYKDSLNSYTLALESGWVSLSGVSDFKRIYELMIVGNYKSTHKLRISIAYDYDDSWIHSGVFDPDTKFPVEYYGSQSPYGEADNLYGGKNISYLVRVKMKRQKCAAFKFKIEELVTTATTGTQQSLTISDIGILVGLKRGQVKVSKGRTMGVQ